MNIDKLKFTDADFNGQDVSSLPDNPSAEGISASELKARFDNIGKMMIALGKHNELIDALMDTEAGKSGAENIGVSTIFGAEGTNVQDVLESVRRLEVEDKAELLQKFNEYVAKTDIVQMRGRSTTAVMSQKAVTDAIDAGGGGGGGGGEFEPVGCMKFFAGETLPDGYLWCDGASYPTTGDYKTLFEIIGTRYNQADDMANTFRVPDMRGRVGVGKDEDTFDTLGKAGGEEKHGLTVEELPSHDHVKAPGGYTTPASVAQVDPRYWYYPSGAIPTPGALKTGATGGGQTHNNLQPYLVCNYIIKYGRSYEEIGVTAPPCIWAFSDSDWQENEAGGYVLNIPEREHRRGEHCVLTALYDTTETDKMKAVLFEMEKNSAGDIVIYSDTAFEGTAYIDRVYLVPAGRVLSVNGKTADMDGDVPVVEAKNQNLIINGDFQVWQRGTEALGGSGGKYTADRWLLLTSNSIEDINVEKAIGVRQKFGVNARKDITLDTRLSQYIEIVNADWINGKTFTLSFEAIANIAGRKYTAFVSKKSDIDNTFGVLQVEMPEANKEYKFTLTFAVPEGAVTEEDILTVGFGLASSEIGTYGADSVNIFKTGNLCIDHVKLEYGNVATPFVHRLYSEELLLCQRYYQVLPSDLNGAIAYTPTNANVYVKFIAPMRIVPTISGVSFWYIAYNGGLLDKLTIQEIYARGNTGMAFTLGTFASKPAQAVCAWGNNALMNLDAEIY